MPIKHNVPHVYKADPFKNINDIQNIEATLFNHERYQFLKCRDYTLFVIGINTGLYYSDLLELTYDTLIDSHKQIRNIIDLHTDISKYNLYPIYLNQSAQLAIKQYFQLHPEFKENDCIFPSYKNTKVKHTSTHAINLIIKEVTNQLNIQGNYNVFSLRKTFLYHMLGIQDTYTEQEVKQIYFTHNL